jgi:hypothetical protein
MGDPVGGLELSGLTNEHRLGVFRFQIIELVWQPDGGIGGRKLVPPMNATRSDWQIWISRFYLHRALD